MQQAHAQGIAGPCLDRPYRVMRRWPPAGNTTWPTTTNTSWSREPAWAPGPTISVTAYYLDPGSPDVQEYLLSIVRELVTNYPIDGIHFDYIRYMQTDAGYPADTSYANSSLEAVPADHRPV